MKRAVDPAHVLVAAGLDPSGRAGLLADVAAVRAQGAVPLGVATALTAQGRRFVVQEVGPELLAAQLAAVLEGPRPRAVKVGMVGGRRALGVLWRAIGDLGVPVVIDPVVRTSRGERLSRLSPADYRRLAGRRVWITPNVVELGWLLGREVARTADGAAEQARALGAMGFGAVVVKGGHLPGAPVDLLVQGDRLVRFRGGRMARGRRHRGTGCRFASTLAAALALGRDGETAVRDARMAVRRYLRG